MMYTISEGLQCPILLILIVIQIFLEINLGLILYFLCFTKFIGVFYALMMLLKIKTSKHETRSEEYATLWQDNRMYLVVMFLLVIWLFVPTFYLSIFGLFFVSSMWLPQVYVNLKYGYKG